MARAKRQRKKKRPARPAFDVSQLPIPPSGGSWGLPADPLANVGMEGWWTPSKGWQSDRKKFKLAQKEIK